MQKWCRRQFCQGYSNAARNRVAAPCVLGYVLRGDDYFVGVGLDGRGGGELGGVAIDDVIGGFGEPLFVEAVLEDGSFRFGLT